MPKDNNMRTAPLLVLLAASSAIAAQTPAPHLHPIDGMNFRSDGPVLRQHAEALKPFTVAGQSGVLLGQQDGTFEAWLLPLKLLSHLTIEANIEGYTVPIDVNAQSAEIEVRPDRTIITYAHIGFTVRQIMYSPASGSNLAAPVGRGPVVLFQFDCLHPTDFTIRFTPELRWMWPERNEGVPGVEWVTGPALKPGDSRAENDTSGLASSGFYVLHSDYPDLAAALAIPGARAGILAPYQERPQVHPVEFKLHIDPTRDRNAPGAGRLYPLLMAYGADREAAKTNNLGAALQQLNDQLPELYAAHAEAWRTLLDKSVSIDTPDKQLNEAFQWAVVSIEQLKAKPWIPKPNPATNPGSVAAASVGQSFSPDNQTPKNESGASAPAAPQTIPTEKKNYVLAPAPETALVAGYYASGDSARPGFGWFFGRDALYTLYAVNGFGDFALTRSELEFLIHRQRADGKIMHEYSQTAAAIDWQQFSYMYAAADSTPLFLMATYDYVRSSGDVDFLKRNREAVEKAWAFETEPAHDTDHDGIYDNSQGTGWVESWPGGMPHQEIYLALLDQQASSAFAEMQRLLGNNTASDTAKNRAQKISSTIEHEYYDAEKGCYAFATNPAGSPNSPADNTTTVYPAVAWWDSNAAQPLVHADQCLQRFASAALNTDWGLRDVSNEEKIYNGMSYHQGSVWPLFTGWAALAEYRGNQPLAGYQLLKENANLTFTQDIGAVTELLSGDYFAPFGRSTSHQLWSSAMVITPTLRGLFGITIDAQKKEITVNPHLPASWDHAILHDMPLGNETATVNFTRVGREWLIGLTNTPAAGWKLRSDQPGIRSANEADESTLHIPTPELELDESLTGFAQSLSVGADLPNNAAFPGARTSRARVLNALYDHNRLSLTCEGLAGTQSVIGLFRRATLSPRVESGGQTATISAKDGWAFKDPKAPLFLVLDYPKGEGWKTITVTLTW
jgi:glycogen debranching enzyme